MKLAAICAAPLFLTVFSCVAFGQAAPVRAPAAPSTAPVTMKRNLEVDDYFRIKEVEGAQISPEGKWVAYTVETHDKEDDKSRSRIWMVPSNGGEAIPLTAESASSSHPRWSPDGKFLAFLSARGGEDGEGEGGGKTQVWILHREGGEAQQLTDTMQDVDSFEWSPSSDRLELTLQDPKPGELEASKSREGAIAKPRPRPWVIDRLQFKDDETGYLDRRRKHLYVFTLATRKLVQVTSGDYEDGEPAWSPDGRSLAFASNRTAEPDSNFNSTIWVVAVDNTDKDKNLVHVTTGNGTDGAPTWSPDGKWIAYTTQIDPHLFEYATFDLAVVPAGGGVPKILTRAFDRNVSAPHFCPNGRWIYFIADDDGTQNLLQIRAEGGDVTRAIGDRRMVDAYSISKDGTVAAQISENAIPYEVYLLSVSGELRRLSHTNDALMSQIRLGDKDYVHFKSKDGMTIAGYITKPPDFEAGKRYPTIIWPHGGPQWAWYAEFNFLPRLFAANGYVVLTPNPRGSTGYGQDFCEAIYADSGNKDYQDDMAEVDYAIAQGIADSDRLGVGGHSYGAISTNFIITQTTRFKAAISNAGTSLYITNYGHDLYQREWEMELGLPWENRALWEKLSPFNSITKIKTPTLVEGGEIDWNVPIINGEQLYQGLKRLGVPTLLVVYPSEHHELSRPSFQADIYERDLAWFNHYVKGEGPAIPAEKLSD